MKTAMAELIEKHSETSPVEFLMWLTIYKTNLLNIERLQIEQAHTEGQALIVGLIAEHLGGFEETMYEIEKARNGDADTKSEEYFTQTYNPIK